MANTHLLAVAAATGATRPLVGDCVDLAVAVAVAVAAFEAVVLVVAVAGVGAVADDDASLEDSSSFS